MWNPVGYSFNPVGLQTDVREEVQRLGMVQIGGAQSCLGASFSLACLISLLRAGPEVLVFPHLSVPSRPRSEAAWQPR